MEKVEAPASDARPSAFICEMCGPDKPVERIFQCQICLKDFCVEHLGAWIHDCYHNE